MFLPVTRPGRAIAGDDGIAPSTPPVAHSQTLPRVAKTYDREMAQTSRQPVRELVEENRGAIKALACRHRGLSISLFGSVALETDNDSSDIDFLVQFEPGSSLFDLLHLQDDLEDLLGRPVDVVSAGGLKTRDDRIRREVVSL